MAATRLIALHVNKGKTVAQCLADRTDYSQNAAKTNDGEFISSYECDPKTADEEFLLSKRQYQHITGRQQKNNIIAYQIRQSFKPGEITPEEANQVSYETAMRWTKGKHAFTIATHIDKSHIHNHIIYNSTSLDATRKFKNFFLSGLAVQRLSDMVCLEHGLSIITPKPYRERQKRTVYPKKRTQRDELCDAIDAVLKQKPKSFDGFVQALADMGFEFKDGKQPAFKGENQKRFIRLRSLGEGYSKEEIQAVISGKNLHKSKGGSAKAPAPKQFQMLIDIQAKMAEGKTVGYEKWAKKFNRKEAARTVILLKEKGLGNYDDLTAHIENLSARFDALSDSIKVAEKRMVEVQALQQHIKNYRNTRQIYIEYRKSGYRALSPLGCIWTDVAALLIKIPQRIDIRGDAVDLTGGNFLRHFIKRDCRERETYNKKDKSDCCVDVRFIDFHHDSPDGTYFSIRSCSSGTESRPAAYLL